MTRITQKKHFKYIVYASMLFVILMLPNTNMLTANAVLQHLHPELPLQAQKSQQQIDEQMDLHPDWIGILTWNSTSASINYLGPGDSSPYKIDHAHWSHAPPTVNATRQTATSNGKTISVSPLVTLYTTVNVFDSIYWHYFGGGNSIYKIQQSYPLVASSTSGVDLYHWLDSKNSNTNKFLQVSAMYDKADLVGTTPAWYVFFDRWDTTSGTGCSEDSTFPQHVPVSFTTGNTATAFIRADSVTAGRYILEVDSGSNGGSLSTNISGDTGHNIDIGRTSNCSKAFPSGAEVEEQATSSTSVYYYGTNTYTYGFYDTSSSSMNTSIYSYNGKEGFGGSVTASTSPAYLTFSCTGALTCP